MFSIKEEVRKSYLIVITWPDQKKNGHFLPLVIFKYDKCWHCESYYGPCFGEPLCMTCHLFLYASNTNTALEIDESGQNGSSNKTNDDMSRLDPAQDIASNRQLASPSRINGSGEASGSSQVQNMIEVNIAIRCLKLTKIIFYCLKKS